MGDTGTIMDTLAEAEGQLGKLQRKASLAGVVHGMEEVVADKGYHSDEVLFGVEEVGSRSYVSEPERGRRRWRGERSAQRALYANRRRARGARGEQFQRLRGERVERSFAHMYATGGMRRTHLRGRANILKRLLIHASGFNPGRLLREMFGRGTPRGLQGRSRFVLRVVLALYRTLRPLSFESGSQHPQRPIHPAQPTSAFERTLERHSTTGCCARAG